MGFHFFPHFCVLTHNSQELRAILMEAIKDTEPEVRSNAAFALGVLVENSDVVWTKEDFEAILFRLRPFFQVPEGAPKAAFNARDNAAGAVSRIILANASLVPLDTVLPVLYSALPLEHDPLENRPLFRALFLLFSHDANYVLNYMDKLVPVFAHVLDPTQPDEIGTENRAGLLQLLTQINGLMPGKLQDAGLGAFLI
jgi:importin-4